MSNLFKSLTSTKIKKNNALTGIVLHKPNVYRIKTYTILKRLFL